MKKIKRSKANVTQKIVKDYFEHLKVSYLDDIVSSNIIKYDETNFTSRAKKVIVGRWFKHAV